MNALLWKPIAAALLLVLGITCVASGTGWFLARRERDLARAELLAERDKRAACSAALDQQNSALAELAEQKAAADLRGQAARQAAAAQGKRFDQALAQVRNAKATTCAEAMPAVNMILEFIR
ncbi:hypothetical protein [Massilia antarctica]|uniref:hypothetical protein n=1 Tax=Massilia antarctica TaxID=2765360 RepID=UPI0006BB5A82|nr:hypothetical protein [Massilia sp. H27-R4]MCY0911136.1 hypothetical protein [Massilia sp. H27-R4]CUI05280.1 hypothetical protein BN2497_5337 [Janthinobacterium sp. CG23_2]CUU29066.1 hypothetical protein BN3177_5337 [Janthinobacterium sp. CG23_2]